MTDENCPICFGIGWVCENHPDRAWDEKGCQCGAGMPCECQRAQRIGRTQYERSDRERSTTTAHRGKLSENVRAALRELHERAALVPLPGAPLSVSADRANSIQSSASRSHAALSISSVAVLAFARHSSAFRRYRSAFSLVMPYDARRADPFQAVSAPLMTLPP
jgi:hypothetical protein